MTFIQAEFLWFFALVLTTYWLLRRRVWQNALLVVCSAIFYGWVHPWFLLLLYGSATLDFFVGRQMRATPQHARRLLVLSMCGNLGMLGYFKYAGFFVDNVRAVLGAMGVGADLGTLDIFLPVGISFYTFQTMSYTIDIYRGKLEPRSSFLDYVGFVSFFPQLVAGPVERASNLLPQMEQPRTFDWDRLRSGFALALWGGFKKVCVADTVAPYVNKVFVLSEPSGALVWAATLGFALQILADFSGYTDIARGTARMMGFSLMKNFDHPYLSVDPSDFWRRWHISFSTWIRDYIYIPVGGSRGGLAKATRSTFVAMVLSGLWHGASWTFVIWGAYHAALLTGYRLVSKRIPAALRTAPGARALAVLIMFVFTVIGWLIFRETHIDRLAHFLTLPPWHGTTDERIAATTLLAVTGLCASPLLAAVLVEKTLLPAIRSSRWYLPYQSTLWALYAVGIFIFVRVSANDFIYFQF